METSETTKRKNEESVDLEADIKAPASAPTDKQASPAPLSFTQQILKFFDRRATANTPSASDDLALESLNAAKSAADSTNSDAPNSNNNNTRNNNKSGGSRFPHKLSFHHVNPYHNNQRKSSEQQVSRRPTQLLVYSVGERSKNKSNNSSLAAGSNENRSPNRTMVDGKAGGNDNISASVAAAGANLNERASSADDRLTSQQKYAKKNKGNGSTLTLQPDHSRIIVKAEDASDDETHSPANNKTNLMGNNGALNNRHSNTISEDCNSHGGRITLADATVSDVQNTLSELLDEFRSGKLRALSSAKLDALREMHYRQLELSALYMSAYRKEMGMMTMTTTATNASSDLAFQQTLHRQQQRQPQLQSQQKRPNSIADSGQRNKKDYYNLDNQDDSGADCSDEQYKAVAEKLDRLHELMDQFHSEEQFSWQNSS